MDMIKIGKFIAELRHENEFTQEELGDKLGVTNKTISRWENGNYLPSVEMLQMLSNIFMVSINELLCGERLTDSSYRQRADDTIVTVMKSCTFSLKERYDFWKKKWLKEHKGLIILSVLLFLIINSFAMLSDCAVLSGISVIIALFTYLRIRNGMMIYIENHIYGDAGQ